MRLCAVETIIIHFYHNFFLIFNAETADAFTFISHSFSNQSFFCERLQVDHKEYFLLLMLSKTKKKYNNCFVHIDVCGQLQLFSDSLHRHERMKLRWQIWLPVNVRKCYFQSLGASNPINAKANVCRVFLKRKIQWKADKWLHAVEAVNRHHCDRVCSSTQCCGCGQQKQSWPQ